MNGFKKLGDIQEWLDNNSKFRILIIGRMMGSGKTTLPQSTYYENLFKDHACLRGKVCKWCAKLAIKMDEFTFPDEGFESLNGR